MFAPLLLCSCAKVHHTPGYNTEIEYVSFCVIGWSPDAGTQIRIWPDGRGQASFESTRVEGEFSNRVTHKKTVSLSFYDEVVTALHSPEFKEISQRYPNNRADGYSWEFTHRRGPQNLSYHFWIPREWAEKYSAHQVVLLGQRLMNEAGIESNQPVGHDLKT